jgi:hypothetical protein
MFPALLHSGRRERQDASGARQVSTGIFIFFFGPGTIYSVTVIIHITMMLVCGDILEGVLTDGTAHAKWLILFQPVLRIRDVFPGS